MRHTSVLALAAGALVAANHRLALAVHVSGTITTQAGVSSDFVPWPVGAAAAVLEGCAELDAYFFKIQLGVTNGDSNGSAAFDVKWRGADDILQDVIVDQAPSVGISPCSGEIAEYESIMTFSGAISLYTFSIGSTRISHKASATFTGEDQIIIDSMTSQVVEVPLRFHGDLVSAESFGDPNATFGKGILEVDMTLGGQSLHDVLQVESDSVFPSEATANRTVNVPVAVAPGRTVIPMSFTGRVEAEASARGIGLFGLIPGSSIMAATFPSTIEVGAFRGEGGTPLPPGIRIFSGVDGVSYGATLSPADFNVDGAVNQADLTTWQANLGDSDIGEPGDANFDGQVDGGDFLIWQQALTTPVALPAQTAVPEPTAAALAALCVLLAAWRNRCR